MKIKICFIFFLLSHVSFGQWTSVTVTPNIGIIEGMCFLTPSTGFISGGAGVGKTSDGGLTWTMNSMNSSRDIDFVDSINGFLVGVVGTIKKTTNGGVLWSVVTPPAFNSLWGVSMVSIDTAYLSVVAGTVYKTVNGGISFTTLTILSGPIQVAMQDIDFTDSNHGCACGVDGKIYCTTDGGANWNNNYTTPVQAGLNSIYFVNATTGFAVGTSGIIAKTIDGGTSWITQNSNTQIALNFVHFIDPNNGIIAGNSGLVLRTVNGGQSWFPEQIGTTADLNSANMLTPTSAIVGEINHIYYNNNLSNSISDIEKDDYINVFPNPFNSFLTIKTLQNKNQTITIADITGRTLDQFIMDSNIQKIDLSVLPKGIYHLTIKSDNAIMTKKIIKL